MRTFLSASPRCDNEKQMRVLVNLGEIWLANYFFGENADHTLPKKFDRAHTCIKNRTYIIFTYSSTWYEKVHRLFFCPPGDGPFSRLLAINANATSCNNKDARRTHKPSTLLTVRNSGDGRNTNTKLRGEKENILASTPKPDTFCELYTTIVSPWTLVHKACQFRQVYCIK